MDFQDIIFRLNRYWAKQGCGLMPLGGAGRAVFAAANGAGELWLAGAARRGPADAGRRLAGRYLYRIFLRPAPPDVRKLFLQVLKTAGVDRAEHDLRWAASDGEASRGWTVLLDGLPLASFDYLLSGSGGGARPAGVEIVIGLERLALASQRRKKPADLAWAGRLTYGELHPAEGGEGA